MLGGGLPDREYAGNGGGSMTFSFKPTIRAGVNQFKIPAPYRVWCHHYGKGFLTIEESQKHNKETIRIHQTNAHQNH